MRDLGRLLTIVGALLLVMGVAMTALGRMGIGRLPGDIVFRRGNFTLYFPIVTSIVISIVISLLLWLFRR